MNENYLKQLEENYKMNKENENLADLLAKHPSGFSPEMVDLLKECGHHDIVVSPTWFDRLLKAYVTLHLYGTPEQVDGFTAAFYTICFAGKGDNGKQN